MVRKSRFGRRGSWRFSDTGTKFDGRPKPRQRSRQKPISPALKRDIIHCLRCGSRVVSNVDHCPFCGRSLSPVFARFWFWIIVVFVVAALVVWFINVNLPEESTSPSSPATPELPQVIGSASNSSLKSLSPGTTIDNSGLKVSVKSVEAGPVTASGAQVYITLVEFENTRDATTTLYSTQWMLETSAGVRLDTFVGSSEDGTTLSSNFEAHELSAQARFSGELYFALSAPVDADGTVIGETPVPKLIVYQPSALAYSEDLLVTWSASS